MRWIFCLFFPLFSGCASINVQKASAIHAESISPPPVEELFTQPIKIDSISDIYSLTDSQEREFLKFFNKGLHKGLEANKRITLFLQDYLDNFNFHSDTLVASETLAGNHGNCLSLAILTKALADLGGVDIGYQLVDTPSIYLRDGGIVLSSQHVRSILYNTTPDLSAGDYLLLRGNVTVDYFPTNGTRTLRKIKENEFFSMYYRNKAAEALVVGDLELAYWRTKKALEIKSNDGQAVNTMAIIHERMGRSKTAEKLYRYGLKFGQEKLELLSNYHLFLKKHHRYADAREIANEIEKYDALNPFKYIRLADRFFAEKDYQRALYNYKKAAKVADYLGEAFAGIAKSQFMLGKEKSALRSFKKAIDRTHKKKLIALYQAKYDLLKQRL